MSRFRRFRSFCTLAVAFAITAITAASASAQLPPLPDPGVDIGGIAGAGVTQFGTYLLGIIIAAFSVTLVYAAWKRLRRVV